jgi:peptidoglycan/xylan/chitin deacetylase (PgdA/CDA1 family)
MSDALPICQVEREDPARPPVGRRLKFCGLRLAGQLARLLRHRGERPSKSSFGMLTYHRIAPIMEGFAPPMHNVPPELFRDQLSGLQRQGFRFVSLHEVLGARERGESLPPHCVVVTFDDGYESVHEHAYPILCELKVPATIFVNTGYLDREEPFPFDAWGQAYAGQVPPESYRPLTTTQCHDLLASGLIDLGAHTHTHADFRGDAAMFRRDMRVCLQHLRDEFGIERPPFAFPYGGPHLGFANESLIAVVRELGLPCAVSTEQTRANLGASPYHWGRFDAFPWDTAETLAGKLLGYYSWAPRLYQRVQRASRWRPRASQYATVALPGGTG